MSPGNIYAVVVLCILAGWAGLSMHRENIAEARSIEQRAIRDSVIAEEERRGDIRREQVRRWEDKQRQRRDSLNVVHQRRKIEYYIGLHPETSPAMRTEFRAERIGVGMPLEWATALYGEPRGVEEIATAEGAERRYVWLDRGGAEWVVVTEREGRIWAIRKGAGVVEGAVR